MKTIGLIRKPIVFLALIVTLALLASPALAGNTATVSGEILAPQVPEAQFIGTPTSGYAPLAVQFTDQSTNTPTSWKWEYRIGSGSWTRFSADQNPSYTFTTTGTYSIRLAAKNAEGTDVETKTNYITVTTPPKPVAQYTAAPTTGLAPLTVQFTDQSTNTPTSWKWEYRIGSGSWKQFSNDQNPSYTFTTVGTYSIRLTATNSGGSDDETKSNSITVTAPAKPVAKYSAAPTRGLTPLTVQFTDQSNNTPTSWKWEYRIGSGSWKQFSTSQNPSYTFTTVGTYSIRLTATNSGGSDDETKSNSITVTAPAKPVAKYSAAPTRGLTPLTVQFTDQSTNSPTSWKWEYRIGSGSWTRFSTDQNPFFTFTTTGTYSIRLTATNSGGSDDETKSNSITVTAPAKPVAKYSAAPTRGLTPLTVQFTDQSTNTPTSWKWEYRVGSSGSWKQFSTDQNPSFTFTTNGTYSIRLTATNSGGSDDETKSNSIMVGHTGSVAAYFTASPTSGTRPLTVQFTDKSSGSIDTWEWDFQNDGKYDSTVKNPTFTYTTKKHYAVKLRVTNADHTSTRIRYNYINVK